MGTKRSNGKAKHNASPLNSSVGIRETAGSDKDAEEKTPSKKDDYRRHRSDRSKGGNDGSRKRSGAMSESKLSEEAALTERLFGGGGASGDLIAPSASAAWMDEDDTASGGNATDALTEDPNNRRQEGDGAETLFAIDRSGEEAADDVDEEEEDASHDGQQDNDHPTMHDGNGGEDSEEESTEGTEDENEATMAGAAWRDEDDSSSSGDDDEDDDSDDDSSDEEGSSGRRAKKQRKGVSLADGPNRLRKLRRRRDETDPVSLGEYEQRLRERFVSTASAAARTDWADAGPARRRQANKGDDPLEEKGKKQKKKEGGYASSTDEESDGDDAARRILGSNASLFASSALGRPLPPALIDVVRARDGNLSDPNASVVSAVQFHPGSDEDNPLLMTAGMDKMLRFFRVAGDREEENTKIHGIHFPDMPIACASFLGDSGSVVLSGRRPFFYVYDAHSGKIQKITSAALGREERSLEKFAVSPDGKVIAFAGNDGYVVLVCGRTRRWIGDLKLNGSVRAIAFSGCGEYVMGSGSDGDVYRWHIGSRRCVERFHNEDGTITSSLAAAENFLAVGAESGVVNLYDGGRRAPSSARHGPPAARAPLKSAMNLTTSADLLRFNHDGRILAMTTRREPNGLKLLHVPTGTVFSNWPTSKTPLKYVWSLDFSPGSKYLAVGNDHGKCLLYRLKHYCDE